MKRFIAVAITTLTLAPTAPLAAAQTTSPATDAPAAAKPTISPRARALAALETPITLTFTDARLDHALAAIAKAAGLELDAMWTTDTAPGLDRDTTITRPTATKSARAWIESLLESATSSDASATDLPTWQLTDDGRVQVGPRARLNTSRRLVIYPIRDLVHIRYDFTQAPEIDLQAALQQGQGSGGTLFNNTTSEDPRLEAPTLDDRAEEILALIQDTIETDQWQEHGGTAAHAHTYRDTLIIVAPDYIHRQIEAQ